MLDRKYLSQLRKSIHGFSAQRQEVIKESGQALHLAKRAIFAGQRGDLVEAKEKLVAVEKILLGLLRKYKKNQTLLSEGSLLAALEEYVEADLFFQFLTTGKISQCRRVPVTADAYLAGLCDLPGELYRLALKLATARQSEEVRACAGLSEEIIGELIEFDLVSYLRTKFDQAKQANAKLEKVVYELSLRP